MIGVLAGYAARHLLARLQGRPVAPVLPHPRVPMCPWCGGDVRYRAAPVRHDELDAAGGRGRTRLCSCGTYSRWDLDTGPLPILLASSRARQLPHRHTG